MRESVVSFLSIVFVAGVLPAQPTPVGEEIQVNTFTTGSQTSPAVAADAQGNFVVVWGSGSWTPGPDGDGSGVQGQRFASDGSPSGGEFQVNTSTTGFQGWPSISVDALGDFVVVWESQVGFDSSILGQRFDSDGLFLGNEFVVKAATAIYQSAPSVASHADGTFVVSWNSDVHSVVARRFATDGTPLTSELFVNSGSFPVPDVAVLGDDFVVVLHQGYPKSPAQRFASDGSPLGSSFAVNTTDYAYYPKVASDANGDFVVVWKSLYPADVLGQRFSSAGTALGGELQIETGVIGFRHDLASDVDGNFVAVWWDGDGDGTGIFGRRVSSANTFLGTSFQVNTYTTGSQDFPAVASDADGDLVVAWRGHDADGSGIRAQRFTPVPTADLEITKDDGLTEVLPGGEVVYTLVATNHGPSFADPVTVTDLFPAELDCDWTSVAAGGASGNTNGSGDLNETLAMPAGSSVTYTATCDVDVDATGTLSNTATISSPFSDPVASNDSDTDDDTTLRIADLAVSVTDAPDPVRIDDPVTYAVSVSNAGPRPAAQVRVTSILPLGTTFVGVSGSGWTCYGIGMIVICGLPALGVETAPTLTLTVNAPSVASSLVFQAIVSAVELDPDGDDNSAIEGTVVDQPIFVDGFESGNTSAWSETQ